MDPLCHTFVGASLAATRLGERTRGAAFTLVVAANLPDIDAAAYFWGGDTALAVRRGWTHGILGIAVLPLLLTAVVVAWHRRRRHADVHPLQVALLAYVALLTHPLLDWLNTYGMRWLMPFDGRWSYGDTLYIVDPWLWLLLGGAAFLCFSRRRAALAAWLALAALATAFLLRSAALPRPAAIAWLGGIVACAASRALAGPPGTTGRRRLAVTALALAGLYIVGMASLERAARHRVGTTLEALGLPAPHRIYVGPTFGDPLRWDVLLVREDSYRAGTFSNGGLVGPARLTLDPRPIPRGGGEPLVARALAAPCARGMAGWMRFPFDRVERSRTGVVVHLLDARYARSLRSGFGTAAVRFGPGGRLLGCDR